MAPRTELIVSGGMEAIVYNDRTAKSWTMSVPINATERSSIAASAKIVQKLDASKAKRDLGSNGHPGNLVASRLLPCWQSLSFSSVA